MIIDWTISVSTLVEMAGITIGGIMAFQKIRSDMFHLKVEVLKLSDLPQTVWRHDERIKNLERDKK